MRIERESGENVGSAWAVFTLEEAWELLEALALYYEEEAKDPGWHHHIGEGENELTVSIELSEVS